MNYRNKIIRLGIQVVLLILLLYVFAHNEAAINGYSHIFYYPYQSIRNTILGVIPISIGDILYVLAGIWLLMTVYRWIRYIIRFRTHRSMLAYSVLNTVNIGLFIYILFLLGWGINYNKKPLRETWNLISPAQQAMRDSLPVQARRAQDSIGLVSFDSFLVDKINTYAPHYHSLSYREINNKAQRYYNIYTDSKVRNGGLGLKPSLFSFFMEGLGLEGYYNPITGEGHIDKNLPAFLLPFTISHEMAHQAGIAAEDDANLMAYALGTASEDSTFRYSCYLNLWQYTNNRVFRRDSNLANKFEAQLNKLTHTHLDTLDMLSMKYHNPVAHMTGAMYDNYLKMQNQKQGLRSYSNVTFSAWQLEQKRMQMSSPIHVP